MTDDEAFWYCLTCRECTFFCPSGVHFQSFMMALRELFIRHSEGKYALFCSVCGDYLMPKKEFEYLQKGAGGEKIGELLSVCSRCKKKKYAAALYRVAAL